MGSSELATFEAYCETLYTSPSAEERSSAEAALVQLSTAAEYIPRCQVRLQPRLGRPAPTRRAARKRPTRGAEARSPVL